MGIDHMRLQQLWTALAALALVLLPVLAGDRERRAADGTFPAARRIP
jgi:hypothetical protein